jgi:hypothetical protein
MTDPATEPSKEALEAAREAYRQGKYRNDVIGEFALALDRAHTAGVREERNRCAAIAKDEIERHKATEGEEKACWLWDFDTSNEIERRIHSEPPHD